MEFTGWPGMGGRTMREQDEHGKGEQSDAHRDLVLGSVPGSATSCHTASPPAPWAASRAWALAARGLRDFRHSLPGHHKKEPAMQRRCTNCDRPFAASDLVKEVSKGMEAERKALGLEGVLFRYYRCPACGQADIFVDVSPLPGEDGEAFLQRRQALEQAVRGLEGEQVQVVLSERRPRGTA
jgi:hypothetical protein